MNASSFLPSRLPVFARRLLGIAFACTPALALAEAKPSPEVVQSAIKPQFVNPDNMVSRDGFFFLNPGEPTNDGVFQTEAEQAQLIFASGGGIVIGADNVPGVSNVNRLAFTFTTEQPGKWQVWYRAYFPTKGSWSHGESLGGVSRTILDSDSVGENEWARWVWVKAGVYDLKAGKQELTTNWLGGAILDRIVVAPADTPLAKIESLAPVLSPSPTGQATSMWISAPNFAGWVHPYQDLGAGLGASFEFQNRGEDNWQPLGANSKIPGVFRLRIALQASDSTPVPLAKIPEFRYQVDPKGLFTVETARGRAVFNIDSASLISMVSSSNQQVFTNSGSRPPFRIDIFPGDLDGKTPTKTLGTRKSAFRKDGTRGEWTFTLDEGIVCVMTAGPGPDGTLQMGWKITNSSPKRVNLKGTFPDLSGFMTGQGTRLLYPLFTGQIVENLGSTSFQTYANLIYPGDMSSQWVTIEKPGVGGVAFGAFDPERRQVAYSMRVAAAGAPLDLQRTALHTLAPGATWQPSEFLVSPFSGDWRAGAKPYRDWMLANVPQVPPTPYIDYHQGFHGMGALEPGDYTLLPWQLDQAREVGMRYALIWGQGADLMGACPVSYGASPVMGGKDAMVAFNRAAKEDGFTLGYYFNFKLYTRPVVVGSKWMNSQPMSDLEPELQKAPFLLTKEQVKDLEVRPVGGGSSAYQFWSDMAVNEPVWIDYMMAWVRHYLDVYETNHIYLDQFNHVPKPWLANPKDGSVGVYSDGIRSMVEKMGDELSKRPGRHYATGEGFSDLGAPFGYGLWASTRDAASDPGGYSLGAGAIQGPDYGKFLFPWGNWNEYFDVPQDKAGMNSLLFNLPTISRYKVSRELRREFAMLWSGALYQDTLGIQELPKGLRGRSYLGSSALGKFEFLALAVESDNPNPAEGTLRYELQNFDEAASVWLFTPGEARPVPVEREGKTISLNLPPVRMAYVLIVKELPTILRLDQLPWDAELGSELKLTGKAFRWTKLNTEKQATIAWNGASLTLDLPESEAPGVADFEKTVTLPAKFDADNLVEFRQVLPKGNEVVLGYVSSAPEVRQRMWASHADKKAYLMLENPRSNPQTFALTFEDIAPLVWKTTPPTEVTLAPGESKTLTFDLEVPSDLDTRLWIRGKLRNTASGSERLVLGSLQPPVWDGGFEQCVSEDGKYGLSTHWHRYIERISQDMLVSELGIRVDKERFHGGSQSLRFDANRTAQLSPGQPAVLSLVGRAEAGKKYRMRAWFFREHPEDTLTVTSQGPGFTVRCDITKDDPVGKWFMKESPVVEARLLPNEIQMPFVRFHTYLIPGSTPQKGAVWIDDVSVVSE